MNNGDTSDTLMLLVLKHKDKNNVITTQTRFQY